jgi:hypothetical protein
MRRILAVIEPVSSERECAGCGRPVEHTCSKFYMRDEVGALVSGDARKPYPHRAPCGRVCSLGGADEFFRDGDAVHFPDTCSGKHPPRPRPAS